MRPRPSPAPSILFFAILAAEAGACEPARPSGAGAADAGELAAPPAPSASASLPPASASGSPSVAASASAPPSASASAPSLPALLSSAPPLGALRCPKEMARVADRFCVDKWEMSLIDKITGAPLSPSYPPDRRFAIQLADSWERDRQAMGDAAARATPLPELPAFQREHDVEPMAVSKPGVVPSGYLSGVAAARACENANKRLCRSDEWQLACEGEARQPFPYGATYVQGACNIFRDVHPGGVLHTNRTIGLLDPRMNLVADKDGEPLLHLTGETKRCKSVWGKDAIYDMNGNLDEWVIDVEREPDPETGWRGRMAGGFYSRAKRDGCASNVIVHPKNYQDYSTGSRCCWSP